MLVTAPIRVRHAPNGYLPPALLECLRQRSGRPSSGRDSADADVEALEAESPMDDRYIVCRECGHAITRPSERILVQGSHHHTFANPHGIVFDIGCFKTTIGCGHAGSASDEFTWFPGYSWRVCFCAACLNHLGWLFLARSGDTFHGLILDRLIQPE
jgi:hypothetical protein